MQQGVVMKNPYQVLGVPVNTPKEGCHKAYKKLSRLYHPDNGGDPDKFHEVQEAWKMLENVTVVERSGLVHKTLFSFV